MDVNGAAASLGARRSRSGQVHNMPYFDPFYIIKTEVESTMEN